MWRRAIAALHPDRGGDHESCVWIQAVRDAVCGGYVEVEPEAEPRPRTRRHEAASTDDKPRVPYPVGTDFEKVTRTALGMGATGMPYGRVLSLLADCRPLEHMAHEQARGASYKHLAAIGHAWGMTKRERVDWYRVAEDIPLSDRHAGHILSRLKRRPA
jgi:hypothetical protein